MQETLETPKILKTPKKNKLNMPNILDTSLTLSAQFNINELYNCLKDKNFDSLLSNINNILKTYKLSDLKFQLVMDNPNNLEGTLKDLRYGLFLKLFNKGGINNRKCDEDRCIEIPKSSTLKDYKELVAHGSIHYELDKNSKEQIKDLQKLLVHYKIETIRGCIGQREDASTCRMNLNQNEQNIINCLRYISIYINEYLKEICFKAVNQETIYKMLLEKIEETSNYLNIPTPTKGKKSFSEEEINSMNESRMNLSNEFNESEIVGGNKPNKISMN